MEWVLLRFKLASFLPWSDVRRIPQVRVGGLSIHITESLSSSKGRRKSGSTRSSIISRSSSIKGNNTVGDVDGGTGATTLQHKMTNSISGDWLAGRGQLDDHQEGTGAVIAAGAAPSVGSLARDTSDNSSSIYGGGDGLGTPRRRRRSIWPSSTSSTSFQQPEQHVDRRDSWAHRGRKASIPRASSAGGLDGSGSGIGDGYEWERVAQATLEHALGNEFTAKYRVRHEKLNHNERAAASCFSCRRVFVQFVTE